MSVQFAQDRAHELLGSHDAPAISHHHRVASAMHELFRPSGARINDLTRTVMRKLLESLVEQIEDELRARILAHPQMTDHETFRASLGAERISIARPILERTKLLRDRELIAVLLRRADAYRIAKTLRIIGSTSREDRLGSMLDDPDERISGAAMDQLIAESRGNDRLDDPAMGLGDLPAPLRQKTLWAVAAALRHYATSEYDVDGTSVDQVIESTARDMLAGHESNGSLETASDAFATALDRSGRLDGDLMIEALSTGRITLYVAMLATRSDLPFDLAWTLAANGLSGRHALALRAAEIDPDNAMRILVLTSRASSSGHEGDARIADWSEIYRDLPLGSARTLVTSWVRDPGYRAAQAALAAADTGCNL